MESDIEPLTIINFRHMPFQYHQHIFKIHWACIGPEMTGAKAKRLVAELEIKLKNFKKKWDTISCSLTLLEEFFFYQVHGKRIDGSWSSVHFHCHDDHKNDNVRRRNYSKVEALIIREIKSWRFRHYQTILTATAEPK